MIRGLYNEAFADAPGYRRATHLHIMALRSAPSHDPSSIFIARVNRRSVGFCIGRNRANGAGLINGLGVHPRYRGRGIARGLLRTTLRHLQGRGATKAIIRVHPDNAPALRLYWSEGFVERPAR